MNWLTITIAVACCLFVFGPFVIWSVCRRFSAGANSSIAGVTCVSSASVPADSDSAHACQDRKTDVPARSSISKRVGFFKASGGNQFASGGKTGSPKPLEIVGTVRAKGCCLTKTGPLAFPPPRWTTNEAATIARLKQELVKLA